MNQTWVRWVRGAYAASMLQYAAPANVKILLKDTGYEPMTHTFLAIAMGRLAAKGQKYGSKGAK